MRSEHTPQRRMNCPGCKRFMRMIRSALGPKDGGEYACYNPKCPPRKGDTVRLKRGGPTAKVLATLDHEGIKGGLYLDKKLDGFRYWNRADVDPIRRGPLRSGWDPLPGGDTPTPGRDSGR